MAIDRVNCSLQDKGVSIDIATNMIKGLLSLLQDMRRKHSDIINLSNILANKLKLPSDFPETRKRKKNCMSSELAEDEG